MTVVTLPDPIAAVCAYLDAQQMVAQLLDLTPEGLHGVPAGVRAIFRPDLPQPVDKSMPLACIVVRPAGGYRQMGKETFYLADPRIDLICFAAAQQQATNIARTAALAMQQLTFPQTWEGCLLQSATVDAGPVPLPDQQTLWPACWLSTTVLHGTLPNPE